MMDKLASLGIDLWSMVLYLGNTAVLMVVLIYLLYKPINKFLEKRQKEITDSIDEAQKLQEKFQKESEKSHEDRQKAEAKLRDELSKLQKFTE
ncbi:ATP synthase F0 subunit B [Candidatus Gracilibacteria bacterium]|nr:ATP synthase F0 subunit B [Candidatus Gracilibacteria bacterium]